MLLGYLGPRTNSELAAKEYAASLAGLEIIPYRNMKEVFDSLISRKTDFIAVPVYNSITGKINGYADNIIENKFQKVNESNVQIHHCIASNSAEIITIVSHVEALNQCKNYLDKNFTHMERLAVNSTDGAAEMASKQNGIAAIANLETCLYHGLRILERDIVKNNFSTFWILRL